MLLGIKLTKRHHKQPLDADGYLDQDAEEEEKNLVNDWEVNPSVERDEKDLLDHDGRIDEHIG